MAVVYHQDRFPPEALDWLQLLPLIGPASAAIAGYKGLLHGVPNPSVLLSPLTTREAVLSSQIEGTQATVSEVLEFEAEGKPGDESTQKKVDINEVLNYRAALVEATQSLEKWSLSQRLIRQTHKRLMQGVRGRNRDPGNYRRVPNWIGPEGCTKEQARFVPCPVDRLADAVSRWEAYIHEDSPDLLVQLAIVHAEFEAIHPFLDGNGRLGRLIIPLFLKAKGLLSEPNFYLSGYLEAHRDEYYERLLAVSRDDDWTGWCVFFLNAIIAQAEENQSKVKSILTLYEERKNWVVDVTRSQYAVRALDWIFERPMFRTSHFLAAAEIPRPTAKRILRVFRDKGLLHVARPAGGRRSATLIFPELLNITEDVEAF